MSTNSEEESNRIYIPKEKLPLLVREVYERSEPAGMGFLHYKPGPLPQELLEAILSNPDRIHMDYVLGRACKMTVRRDGDRYYIANYWPDHSPSEFAQLLGVLNTP